MNEKDLKTLQRIVCQNPEAIQGRVLVGIKLKIYKWVRNRGDATTTVTAKRFSISSQYASTYLKSLYDKGYLMRTLVDADSGGNEWLYRSIY